MRTFNQGTGGRGVDGQGQPSDGLQLSMDTSFFLLASDLQGEGLDTVLDNLQSRAGVNGVTLAVIYHDARDVFPHNPAVKVGYTKGGEACFRTDSSLWSGMRLRPYQVRLPTGTDPLADLRSAATPRGMRVNAWAVFLHTDRLGFDWPEYTPENAFGDRYLTHLCPANPEVRQYVRTLVTDIARYEVDGIRAEALSFGGFEHGYHHERQFEDLGPLAHFLLGLCFCRPCLNRAGEDGIDGEVVRELVRKELDRILGLEPEADEVVSEQLASLLDRGLRGYLDARVQTVTSLALEASKQAILHDTQLTFIGLSGAEGSSADSLVAAHWRTGVDPARLAGAGVALEGTLYVADPEQARSHLLTWLRRVVSEQGPAVLLRPMPPDCRSAENLTAKLRRCGT